MNSFDVSVVIPAYQHGAFLNRAVESALRYGAGEVVIVNDASTDNTDVVGQYWHANEPRVMYLRNPFHAGVIYSRNRAVYSATYEMIVPLDADDRLVNLEALVNAYQPGTFVYGGWKELVETKPYGDRGTIKKFNDFEPPPPGMLHSKELGWITMLFSKRDWLDVSGYDPTFTIGNEIWAFQRALVAAGVMPVRVPDVIFERTVGGVGTQRAMAWAHVIKPLMDALYPLPEGVR